ncbi:DUF1622 domain-containing protein [Ilyobacter polytropus]|uniref:DUF1622 domain-containing protein n=1 Tax=Ilyobacter polytropus (strain ATCC 51220 / DSM 2926 / LMG 16218 / CuHBu1) TaxID=572544 RepID=E3H846_ILYPC|nr:DUF1622 domain-containing protein [Ilyobacter polytropus]ADO83277.1 protein of unknown function DUF1622 [Ilyobacter polytropus DSM 2926]
MMHEFISFINNIIINICQFLATIVIFFGVINSVIIYSKDFFLRKHSFVAMKRSRLEIGNSFSLGLSFLIGASILKTILAPTWTDIGKLAATILIRTFLNYFLLRDIESIFEKPKSDKNQKQDK